MLLPSSTYQMWDGADKVAAPGSSVTYEFVISADHPSGTFAYHSHYKGAQSMQSAGFMMGAFIVRDLSGPYNHTTMDAGALYHDTFEIEEHYATSALREYGLAPYLWEEMVAATAPDESIWSDNYQVMMVQWGSYSPSASDYNALTMCGLSDMPTDVLSYMDPTADTAEFAAINGVYQPTVEINVGEWTRWRVVNGASHRYMSLGGFPEENGCEAYVIARDGIYLDSPRQLDSYLVAPAGRADLLVRCKIAGTATISSGSDADLEAAASSYFGEDAISLYSADLMTLNIKDVAFIYNETTQPRLCKLAWSNLNLESALLETLPTGWFGVEQTNLTDTDLAFNEVDVSAKGDTATTSGTSEMSDSFAQFNVEAKDSVESLAVKRLKLGDAQEWTIKHSDDSTRSQSFYIHGYHFQVMSATAADGTVYTSSPTGDWVAGDWLDVVTVPAGGSVVLRFTPTLYEDAAIASYCGESCTSFTYWGADK
jgi:FtsP/CotA-like multicopper oxidase with cupredoxin domain